MSRVRAEIDALLVLEHGRAFELRTHADGCELAGGIDGESGWFRHWPLEPSAGWISTTDENVVEGLWVRDCTPGAVEWPASAAELDADIDLTMPWPAPCSATMEEGGETTRYGLRCSDADPARWVALRGASARVGLGADGALVRIVAEAPPVPRSREAVVVRAGDWSAALQHGRYLHVGRAAWLDGERGELLESAHGTAWLGRLADNSLCSLTIDDAREGDAIDLPEAPRVDEVSLWQRWPAAVRATWWRDGGRTRVQIRFGEESPEQWARIGGGEVWVGSSAAGELRALLFGDVEVASPEFERPGVAGDLVEDMRGDDMVETARSIWFELYGLAGAVGVPSGFGSTYGVPSKLAITFGDPDGDGPSIIVASSRSDRRIARWEALEHLGLGDEAESPDELPWAPVDIAVGGVPAPFELHRIGDRWAAVGRLGRTTIWMAADGYDFGDVSLEPVHDLAPHVEERRRQFGAMAQRLPPQEPPDVLTRLRAAALVLDGLMNALDRTAGAPPIGSAFTERVVASWGGHDRYERLLGLHTMLRQICGRSGGRPEMHDDGSITMCLSLRHAIPSDGSGTISHAFAVYRDGTAEPAPPPDPAAARRGEGHEVDLRLVEENGAWRVHTDLLQILIDRLGSLEEVVRPLSEQTG
ncbi:MAG TPA: hypothetical protein VLB81_00120 [Gaiellales bacterium]|nr:hypothetical protein [Gaiellales bacterium]